MSTIAESPEWGEFLKALSFVEPGAFTLFVLLLADGSLEPKLRTELKRGRRLNTVRVSTPDALRKLAGTILDKTPTVGSAGLWISVTASDMTRREHWQDAWAYAVARLNENRNRLVQRWPTPVILVGPYWLRDVLREIAPDLWSVRSHVFTLAEELRESLPSTPLESMAYSSDFAGDPELALQEAERLRDIPRAQKQRLTYLNNAAIGFAKRYENNKAETLLKEALVLASALGDRYGEGQALTNLGSVYLHHGRYDDAVACFQESIAIERALGDRHGEGQTLMNLGIAYRHQERWEEANFCFEESLKVFRTLGDRFGEGRTLMNLGILYQLQGMRSEVLVVHLEAYWLLAAVGDGLGAGITLMNIAVNQAIYGKLDDALNDAREAVLILAKTEDNKIFEWAMDVLSQLEMLVKRR